MYYRFYNTVTNINKDTCYTRCEFIYYYSLSYSLIAVNVIT